MKKILFLLTAFAFIGGLVTTSFAANQRQWDRASLWNPGTVKMVNNAFLMNMLNNNN